MTLNCLIPCLYTMDNFYFSRMEVLDKCKDRVLLAIKNKGDEWEQASKQYIESNDLQGALMTKEWSFAASFIYTYVLAEFGDCISDIIEEMNNEHSPTELKDELDSEEWNCHQQMNG